MLSLKQINDQRIPIPDEDTRPIKGYDICEEVYANIFLCARKKSGKTSALFKIMKECASKKTILIIFCSTCYKDKNWIQIRKYFEQKGMDIRVYTSIYEDGEDQLSNLIEDLKKEAKEKECEQDEETEEVDRCDEILAQLTNMHSPPPQAEKPEKKTKRPNTKHQNLLLCLMI